MLKVVENAAAIRRYERQFIRALKPYASTAVTVKLGHPGTSEKAKVAWSEGLGIWAFSRKIEGLRYWHAFGIGPPSTGAAVTITCEINFPLCGIDRRTGGAFAADPEGRIYAVHRGKLGGRKGVGKTLFESRYRGVWEVMDDGDCRTPVAVIGSLASPRFARQLAHFVYKIAQLKGASGDRSDQTEIAFDEPTLREVLIGDPFPTGSSGSGLGCDHGLVIQDLAAALASRGFKSGNDGQWDLAAVNRGETVQILFQVRTDHDMTGFLTATAQLLLAAPTRPAARLCLVSPAAWPGDLGKRLEAVQIEEFSYDWQGDQAVFPDLDTLLKQRSP